MAVVTNTFKRYTMADVTGTPTAIGGYTVPVNTQAVVMGLIVSNKNTVADSIKVSILLDQGDSATDIVIVKDNIVPKGESYIVIGWDQKLVLEHFGGGGDALKISCDTAASADVVMSVLEIVTT